MLFLKFRRTHPEFLSEGIGKIVGVGIAAMCGDLVDPQRVLQEKLLCVMEAKLDEVARGRGMELIFEFPDESHVTEVDLFGQCVQIDLFRKMVIHVAKDEKDILGIPSGAVPFALTVDIMLGGDPLDHVEEERTVFGKMN